MMNIPKFTILFMYVAIWGSAIFAFAFHAELAKAQQIDAALEYERCLNLAQQHPEQGFEEAGAWLGLGGGEAARHCSAVSLLNLGEHAEAARRLEALAEASRQQADIRASMLAQAAQGWILAGDLSRAVAVQGAAIALLEPAHPLVAELLVDRAVAWAEAGDFTNAVADLTEALAKDPLRVDALVLRATAYRFLENLPAAMADAEAAVKRDRYNQDALLERGILHRLMGQNNLARKDWLAVVNIDPSSPAARSAQGNLAKLDVKTD